MKTQVIQGEYYNQDDVLVQVKEHPSLSDFTTSITKIMATINLLNAKREDIDREIVTNQEILTSLLNATQSVELLPNTIELNKNI